MKRKEYIIPLMKVVELNKMRLLTGSGVTSDGIDYGGVDEDGILDPSAPGLFEF